MLFSYVPFGVTVMVLGCPDYLQLVGIALKIQRGLSPQNIMISFHKI
jgi:hypothetical protein